MLLDAPNAFVEARQRHAVPDHRLMVLVQRRSELAQPGNNIIDLPAVLVEYLGNLTNPAIDLLEAFAVTANRLRHFGQQLVDRCQVDAVAALHGAKRVHPTDC